MAMEKARKISPFRLAALLRLEPNPTAALHLFRHPNTTPSVKPFRYSALSYDLIICKLARARMFDPMEQILDQMLHETRFLPSDALLARVITFYGRARLPAPALRLFHRHPTLRSFNSLLHALLLSGDLNTLQSLLRDSGRFQFTPDACTYNILIRAAPAQAHHLFDEMLRRGISPTPATFSTLITLLCRNSNLDKAFKLKQDMVRVYALRPNAHIYTSLIKALCNDDKLDEALKLKEEMLLDREVVADSAVYSTLIRAHFRAGRKGDVVGLMEEMKGRGVEPDTVTYNVMIAGFCGEGSFDAAFEALEEMGRNGCKPDVVSYNTILAGFCKGGRWREASDLFEDMPRRGCSPDVVSYRSLFEGMCIAGEVREADKFLDEMLFKGYVPAPASVRKFVEGLCGEGDGDLVKSGLSSLAQRNAMDFEGWVIAVRHLLKDSWLSEAQELMDCLRIG